MEAFSSTEKAPECYPRRQFEDYGQSMKTLGSGVYGEVYLTTGGKFGRPVAVKKVHRFGASKYDLNPNALMEIALLTRLNHPFIPRILDVFWDENYYYLIQESPGSSLEEYQLTPGQSAGVIASLAQVYAYLKQEQILHLDLKSSNVLWSPRDGSAYLIDFGIALSKGPADLGKSPEAYTANFRSPEILLGDGIDEKSEIWALGVLWLHLLKQHGFLSTVLYHLPRDSAETTQTAEDFYIALISVWQKMLGPIWPGAKYLPRGDQLILLTADSQPPLLKTLTSRIESRDQEILASMLRWDPTQRPTAIELAKIFYPTVPEPPSVRDCLRRRSQRVLPKIDLSSRTVLLKWLIEVKSHYGMTDRIYFLAVQLLDIFSSGAEIALREYQAFGIVAIYLACSMLSAPIQMEDLRYLTARAYTIEDLLEKQNLMLKILCFDLYQATAFDFLTLALPRPDFKFLVRQLRVLIRTTHVTEKSPEELAAMIVNGETLVLETEDQLKIIL